MRRSEFLFCGAVLISRTQREVTDVVLRRSLLFLLRRSAGGFNKVRICVVLIRLELMGGISLDSARV
jgi:hypothetical protein